MNLREYNRELSQNEFERIEDTLVAMMESKRVNPFGIMFLFPDSEAEYVKWEETGCSVSTYPSYTNAPIIGLSDDDYDLSKDAGKLLEMISDEKEYVSRTAARIIDEYGVNSNQGWTLSAIGVDMPYEIYLFINSTDWSRVKGMIGEFNDKMVRDGFQPAFTVDD